MKQDEHYHHHHHQQQFQPAQLTTLCIRRLRNFATNIRTNHKSSIYVILLILSYALGYFSASSSISSKENISPTVITTLSSASADNCSTVNDDDHNRFGPQCAEPIPAELIRPKIINRIFNGTSPYENFPPAHVAQLLRPKRVKGWGSYGTVFETLINKVKPKTIIEVGTFLGASAIHMAELTRQLGLETQILCLDDFRGWPGFQDKKNYIPMQNGDVVLLAQFMQNVIYFNSTGLILPVPFSTGSGLQKLCEWGVMADLIEVDAGHDFQSAWADINRAHKLLRPGGVLFGHDYFTSYDNRGVRRAVDLFARVNGFKVKPDGQHWVIFSS